MAASSHVKKGDIVTVISGHESIKGKSGKVLQVFPGKNRVIIEGLRMIKKHQKATQNNQQGGIVEREGSIHISNVRFSGDAPKEKKTKAKTKTPKAPKAAKPAKQAKPAKPAKSAKPDKRAKPAKPAKPDKRAKPAKSSRTTKTAKAKKK